MTVDLTPSQAADRLSDLSVHRRQNERAYRQGLISDLAYRVVLADLQAAEWTLQAIIKTTPREASHG